MKVRLTKENLISFLAIYYHCELKQYVYQSELEEYTEITCAECGDPVMFRGSDGLWYYASHRVFE